MDKYHILLVEDNQGDIRLVREALHDSEIPCQIEVAENGKEALALLGYFQEKLPENLPELILLDLNLPLLSGREVLAMLKKNPRYWKIPVVIFSSSANQDDIQFCYQSRANCYISKPTGFEGYIQVIQQTMDFWFESASLPPHFAPT